MNTTVLAVDTSNNRSSLALIDGDQTLYYSHSTARDNLGWLRVEVEQALLQAALELVQIQRFAVAHGPGALTGVRVGVGFVQALAFGAGRPLVGVNTLSAMGWQLRKRFAEPPSAGCSVALDARMGEIYVAHWPQAAVAADFLQAADRVIAPEKEIIQHPPSLAGGPGWEAYAAQLPTGCTLVPGIVPDALDVAQLALNAPAEQPERLHVHYLRREVAQVPERLRSPQNSV